MIKILIVLMVSFLAISTAQKYVSGETVSGRYRNARAGELDPAIVCPNTFEIKTFCLEPNEPCSSPAQLFKCKNGLQSDTTETCGTDKPFCIGDPGYQFCSAISDPTKCSSVKSLCRSPGYFPDPTDCSFFYLCFYDEAFELKIVKRQCPGGSSFNPAGPGDRKCLVGGTCVRADCTAGLTTEWRAFNYVNFTTNRIAMKCINSELEYVHQCDTGLSLDTAFLLYPKCSIICNSNYQKAVYPADNTKYYMCILGYTSVESCEYKYVFNPHTLNCEPKTI